MSPSTFSPDCKEFITILNKYDVKWVIIGGEAVIYYGHVRLTGDVDFFYGRDDTNVQNLWNALNVFWDQRIPGNLTKDILMERGAFFQFGVPPNRIDLMNEIDGVGFDEVWKNRVVEKIKNESITVNYIGLEQLIKNKSMSNRPKDIEDLKFLKR